MVKCCFAVYTYYYTNVESGKCENKKVKHCLNYSLQFFFRYNIKHNKNNEFQCDCIIMFNKRKKFVQITKHSNLFFQLIFKNKLAPPPNKLVS